MNELGYVRFLVTASKKSLVQSIVITTNATSCLFLFMSCTWHSHLVSIEPTLFTWSPFNWTAPKARQSSLERFLLLVFMSVACLLICSEKPSEVCWSLHESKGHQRQVVSDQDFGCSSHCRIQESLHSRSVCYPWKDGQGECTFFLSLYITACCCKTFQQKQQMFVWFPGVSDLHHWLFQCICWFCFLIYILPAVEVK